MRILVSVPAFDGHIEMETVKAVCGMCKSYGADFYPVHGYDIASARNAMAKRALEAGYDYLMMIDSDTVPPENALGMLLEGGCMVKVGTYVWSDDNSLTVASRLKARNMLLYDGERLMTRLEVKALGGASIRIAASGLGCALIKTDVFKKLKAPFFKWVNYDSGDVLGEDLYFAEQCKAAGIPIILDSRVLCGHIKPRVLTI